MKAIIVQRYKLGNEWGEGTNEFIVNGPDIAVQGGMFGIEHIVDGKKVWLYLPIKNLIKIEIHE